jgi:hypothetical protein
MKMRKLVFILIVILLVLVASACSNDLREGETHSSDAPASTDSSGGISFGTSSDGSGTGSPPQPEPYPRPQPVAGNGDCPDDSFGPITFDGDAWVCIPECGTAEPLCPSTSSGTAEPACASNPFSSAAPCEDNEDCSVDGEMCGNVGNGQRGCLLPPTHCILRCAATLQCPEHMICTLAQVCAYPPS